MTDVHQLCFFIVLNLMLDLECLRVLAVMSLLSFKEMMCTLIFWIVLPVTVHA